MSIVTETKNLYTAGLVYSLDQKLKISQLKSGDFPQDLDTQALESWMQELGCQLCVQGMPNYHYKFSTIRSAPYLVYFLGDLALLDKSLCGIVGPRAMSPYGDRVIQDLFGTMQAYDCATVSGLADGVDTLTHELSLERGIPTIAVLGGGIAWFLRQRQRELIQRIVQAGGLVISEFKLKKEPTHYTFPQRNRIIAGLSDVLFVPEAGQGSGSLITVDFALQMHKPVCVVPGSIYSSTSAGVNQLLADGKVRAVHDMGQFCSSFLGKMKKDSDLSGRAESLSLSSDQTALLACFEGEGVCKLEGLLAALSWSTEKIMSELTMLEMYGCVRSVGVNEWGV